MQTDALVYRFYNDLWNAQDYDLSGEILSPNVRFRGSLGAEKVGVPGFISYAKSMHQSLSGYSCEVKQIVSDESSCACKMMFSGVHTGEFMGFAPTGASISWTGAAFFSVTNKLIQEVWVLGDLITLREQLESNRY